MSAPSSIKIVNVSRMLGCTVFSEKGGRLYSCPPTHATIKEVLEEVTSVFGPLSKDLDIDLYETQIGSLTASRFLDSYKLGEMIL
jgi:hypothetical protein